MKKDLSDIHQRVVALKMGGKPNYVIAQELNISRNTITTVLKLPEVQAEIRNARREAHAEAIQMLAMGATEAVRVLEEVMKDKENPSSVRVRAAESYLSFGFKGMEVDVVAELDELRAMVQGAADVESTDAD